MIEHGGQTADEAETAADAEIDVARQDDEQDAEAQHGRRRELDRELRQVSRAQERRSPSTENTALMSTSAMSIEKSRRLDLRGRGHASPGVPRAGSGGRL